MLSGKQGAKAWCSEPERSELIAAREKITWALEELRTRRTASIGYPSPDNRALIAKLEDELREINIVLATGVGVSRP